MCSVAVLRRHDYSSELSVIEAQWPGPTVGDQMGSAAVPFAADPAMITSKAGREPFVRELGSGVDARAHFVSGGHCRGKRPVAMTCVPLLGTGQPWGMLSLFHFGRRVWAPEELHMLQAVGALLMQMQARIEAEDQTLHNAVHDELTGLPNRRALLAAADRAPERSQGDGDSLLRPRSIQGDERLFGARQRRHGFFPPWRTEFARPSGQMILRLDSVEMSSSCSSVG